VLFFYFVPDTTRDIFNISVILVIFLTQYIILGYSLTYYSFFSYPNPAKWGWYNMLLYHVVIKIRQLFLQPAAFFTSTLLETGVGANDCKCSRDR
jgi:hypothetical protein